MASSSSPKRRRGIEKRVVSVPIRDVEGSRLRGDGAPPSIDRWAWRKYGQKPIKGSPYPRGYYRCSSSKGCPARKQVERSRADPNMVVVTYSCEHNHPWPAARNTHHHNNQETSTADAIPVQSTVSSKNTTACESRLQLEPDEKFANLGEANLIGGYEFNSFSDWEVEAAAAATTTSTWLESPRMGEGAMKEEDEWLFADLEELPECSAVFRRRVLERAEEECRRCNLATTG
ncbi:probable WRKY transcription factor 69 isoform X2 [Diospyros lotus]|uniref:probable WRKY transcription factor 69 isoform X2 n=1 Tax=Diospyros lotus TaxID=55363 RepID=UPI00225AB46F|nr:probable WRKY transcription factor 69 isoform X2 [Diospyros lotus]